MDSELQKVLEAMADLPEFLGLQLNGVNTKGKFGNFPLHIAAMQGNLHAVTVLLANGADPRVVGEDHLTPAEAAFELDRIEAARLLESAASSIGKAIIDDCPGP